MNETHATPQIVEQKTEFATPWFELISKRLAGQSAPYYALRMSDYVLVLAFTRAHELVLVRQYRPAVERFTLELPSGHVEKNESPAEAARRELAEECGFEADHLELLGPLLSDSGRIQNRLWCYYAESVAPVPGGFKPEPDVERLLVPVASVSSLIKQGEFDFSMHLAALALALVKNPRNANVRQILLGPTSQQH
jgi:ADP-ribose pyrophosphatase